MATTGSEDMAAILAARGGAVAAAWDYFHDVAMARANVLGIAVARRSASPLLLRFNARARRVGKELVMPTVRDILSNKSSSKVHTIRPGATVLEAIERMNEHGIGALVVTEGEHVVGMFTERDVLRRVVGKERPPGEMFVAEVMTGEVACTGPGEDLDEVRAVMKNRRIRHLPVCDQGMNLLGLISIGDLNAYDASNQEATIHFLNEYIYGRV